MVEEMCKNELFFEEDNIFNNKEEYPVVIFAETYYDIVKKELGIL